MKKPPVISITEKNAITRKRANILSVENLSKKEHPGVETLSSNDNRKFSKRNSVSRQFGSHNKSNLTHQPGFESKISLPVDSSLTEIPSIVHYRQQSLNSDFLERQNILRKVCAMKVNNFFAPSSRQEDYAAVLLKKCCSNSNIDVLHNGQCNYDSSENSLTNDVTHGNSAEKIEGIIEVSADIAINSTDNSETNRPLLENFTRYSHPSQNFTCREYLLSLGQLFKQYKDSAYETSFLLRRKFNAFFEFCWFEIRHIVWSVFLFVFGGIRNARDEFGKYYFRFFAFANGLWALITNAFHLVLSMIRSWIFLIIEIIHRCLTSLVLGVRGVSHFIAVPNIFINNGVPKNNESQPQAIGTEGMLFQIFKFFINNVRKCYKSQPPLTAVSTTSDSISVPELISQPSPEPPSLVMNASISDSELILQNALSTSGASENSFAYEKIYPDITEEFNAVLSPEHNDEFQLSSPMLVAKSRSEETVSYELIYGKNGEDYIPTQSDTSSPEFVGFDEFKRGEDDIHLSQIYPTGDSVCTPSLVVTSHSAIYDFNSNEGHVLDNFRRGNLNFENIENYQLYESYLQNQSNGTAEQLLYSGGGGAAKVLEWLQSPCPNEKSVSVNESTSDDSAFMAAAVSSEEQQQFSHSKDGRVKIVESPFVDLTDVYLARSYDDSLEHEYIIPDLCRTQLASGTGSGDQMPSATGRARVQLDMKDLDGLRGVAAIWIVFFHSFLYSSLGFINLQGSTLMPLFFLLSGFALTAGYQSRLVGEKSHHPLPLQVSPDIEINSILSLDTTNEKGTVTSNPLIQTTGVEAVASHNASHNTSHTKITATTNTHTIPSSTYLQPPLEAEKLKNYFYNRCIRVLPVYYICLIIAIPVNLAGWASVDPANKFQVTASFITNILPTNTWFAFLLGRPFNVPSWTICTLLFFWILFPWLLRYYDRHTDEQLLYVIVRMYWVQALLVTIVWIILMSAGLRHATNATMPWFTNSFCFIPPHYLNFAWCFGPRCWNWKVGIAMESTHTDFKRTVLFQIIQILTLTIVWLIIIACTRDINSNMWFQGLNVFSQLAIIVGLVRLNGPSISSIVLRHPIILWFGEISMSLYLVHEMIIYYIRWIMHHGASQSWPSCSLSSDHGTACQSEWSDYSTARQYPAYLIPIILPIGTAIAACFYYCIEEPVRIYLK